MNRRDAIILAVLLNTGLLAVLFMTAVSTNDEVVDSTELNRMVMTTPSLLKAKEPEIIRIAVLAPELQATDEWDNVLKDYASSITSQTIVHDEETADELEKEVMQQLVASHGPVPKTDKMPKVTTAGALSGKFIEIKVKRGDALEKIARANGTTTEAIRKINQLSNDKLTIGQALKIPVTGSAAEVAMVEMAPAPMQVSTPAMVAVPSKVAAAVQSVAKAADASVEYYTMKAGDNPWKISKQFHVKFDDLLKLNNLNEEKAKNLKIGDRIRVR